MGDALDLSSYQHIQKFPEGYDSYEVLNMCDVLITDYSSVMYDFANSGKKIILFAYDIEDYAGSRGMYEDIRNYPFPLVRTPQEVAELLQTPADQLDEALRQKYGTYEHGSGIKKAVPSCDPGKTAVPPHLLWEIRRRTCCSMQGISSRTELPPPFSI